MKDSSGKGFGHLDPMSHQRTQMGESSFFALDLPRISFSRGVETPRLRELSVVKEIIMVLYEVGHHFLDDCSCSSLVFGSISDCS